MVDMVKLKAPLGCDEANYGTVRYTVRDDGTITVPQEAAAPLLKDAGFTLVEEDTPPPPSIGSIAMKGKPGSGCSWGGQSFTADATGDVLVPAEAVADLIMHGFRIEGA
jgi:hypothetical protein